MPSKPATRRFLQSSLVDLLLGPHGIDRYLELIRPDLTVSRRPRRGRRRRSARPPRSVTLTLRPNAAWSGFPSRPVRPRRRRDRRRAPDAHVLAGLLAARLRRTSRADRHVAPGRRRLAAISAGDEPGAEPSTWARPRATSCCPQQRPERLALISGGSGDHAGDVDAADAVRRGPRGRGHLRPLRPHAADWLYERRGRASSPSAIRTCELEYVATARGRRALRARQASRHRTADTHGRRLRTAAV